jgi:hypothetical protein
MRTFASSSFAAERSESRKRMREMIVRDTRRKKKRVS